MLKVNMNITRSVFIVCFILTSLIAILISNYRYDIGFRGWQIYDSIIIVYFLGLGFITPLLMTAIYCTTIDEERKKYIINVLNVDDEEANKYLTEIRYPTLTDDKINILSGRNHVLSDVELESLNNEKSRFLFLLRIVKTSKKHNIYSKDYQDENIVKLIKENRKVYDFFN